MIDIREHGGKYGGGGKYDKNSFVLSRDLSNEILKENIHQDTGKFSNMRMITDGQHIYAIVSRQYIKKFDKNLNEIWSYDVGVNTQVVYMDFDSDSNIVFYYNGGETNMSIFKKISPDGIIDSSFLIKHNMSTDATIRGVVIHDAIFYIVSTGGVYRYTLDGSLSYKNTSSPTDVYSVMGKGGSLLGATTSTTNFRLYNKSTGSYNSSSNLSGFASYAEVIGEDVAEDRWYVQANYTVWKMIPSAIASPHFKAEVSSLNKKGFYDPVKDELVISRSRGTEAMGKGLDIYDGTTGMAKQKFNKSLDLEWSVSVEDGYIYMQPVNYAIKGQIGRTILN